MSPPLSCAPVGRALALFLVLLLGSGTHVAWCQDDATRSQPNVPSAPFADDPQSLLWLASENPTHGKNVEIFLDEIVQRFDDSGLRTVTRWQIYQILERSAYESWGNVQREWSPPLQQAPQIRARVIQPDGRVEELDTANVFDTPARNDVPLVYDDRRLRTAPLPGLVPGCIVETHTTVQDQEVLFAGGRARVIQYVTLVPIRTARYILELPRASPHKFWEKNLPASVKRREERLDDLRRFTYEFRDVPFLDLGEHSPAQYLERASAIGFSTGGSWRQVARAYLDEIEPLVSGYAPNLEVSKIVETESSRERTLRDLVDVVRDRVRYTGVEFGKSRIIPAEPYAVLERQYGDCKDQATLLVAMLAQAGIEAHVALVSTQMKPEAVEALPGIGNFDHAVVFVPGKDELWIDTTSPYSDIGHLAENVENKAALIIDRKTRKPVRTPVSSAAENQLVESRLIDLPIEGPARVVERTRASGSASLGLRWQFDNQSSAEITEWLEGYGRDTYGEDAKTRFVASDPRAIVAPFELELDVTGTVVAEIDAAEAHVLIDFSSLLSNMPGKLFEYYDESGEVESDRIPVRDDFGFARRLRVEYVVRPPPHFSLVDPPAADSIRAGPVTLMTATRQRADGSWVSYAGFELENGMLERDEVVAALEAIDDVLHETYTLLTFAHEGAALLTEDDLRGAHRMARAEVDSFPHAVLPRERLSQVFSAAGLGWHARDTLRGAVERAPDSPLAHRAYGTLLLRDLAGNDFGRGMDRDGAIRELRAALELDAENVEAGWSLVQALVSDENGVFYAPGCDTEAALERAVTAYEAFPIAEQEVFLLRLMAVNGDTNRMRKMAPNLLNQQSRDAALVAARTLDDGIEAGMRRARRLRPASYRREVMLEAAGCCLIAGQLAATSRFVSAGMEGAPSDLESERFARVLAAAAQSSPYDEDAERPSIAARRLLDLAFGVSNLDEDEIFARELHETGADPSAYPQSLTSLGGMILGNIQQELEIPPSVLARLAQANVAWRVEGEDDFGYRLWFAVKDGPDFELPFCYVVREKRDYRVLAAPSHTAPIGVRVQKLLDAKQLDDAERWVRWVADRTFQPRPRFTVMGNLAPHERLYDVGSQPSELDLRFAVAAMLLTEQPDVAVRLAEKSLDTIAPRKRRMGWHDFLFGRALCATQRHDDAQAHLRTNWQQRLARGELAKLLASCYEHSGRLDSLLALIPAMERVGVPVAMCRRMEGDVAMRQGDFDGAIRAYEAALEEKSDDTATLNQLLWSRLCAGTLEPRDGERALEAVTALSTQRGSAHTAACVFAVLGKLPEARDMAHRVLRSRGSEQLEASDWLMFGLLAEQLDEIALARSAYERAIEIGDLTQPSHSGSVAQGRLKRLNRM